MAELNTASTETQESPESIQNSKTKRFECDKCDKKFRQRRNLYAHLRSAHGEDISKFEGKHVCSKCNKTYRTSYSLKKHERDVHEKKILSFDFFKDVNGGLYPCPSCEQKFESKSRRDKHLLKHKDDGFGDGMFYLHETVFGNAIRSFRMEFSEKGSPDLIGRLDAALEKASVLLKLEKEKNMSLKVYFSLMLSFFKADISTRTDPGVVLHTDPALMLAGTNIEGLINVTRGELLEKISEFESNGSGWVLENLIYLDLKALKYNPIHTLNVSDEEQEDQDYDY